MKHVGILITLLSSCLLTGCFQVAAVHVLHPLGESDAGGYSIRMNALTYSLLTSDDDFMRKMKQFSRPTARKDGDDVLVEDLTGRASMEKFYDSMNCATAPVNGYADCRFIFKVPPEIAQRSDWSVDWEVVLQRDMRVMNSNHQRVKTEDGLPHLVWFFDGNRDSSARVDFTVRMRDER